MAYTTIVKEALKYGLKSKKGKELMAKAMKSTGISKNDFSKFLKGDSQKVLKSKLRTTKADKKVDALLTAANISLPVAGIYGISEMVGKEYKEKATKKLRAQSNAATKQDAMAKLKKTGGTAAKRFKKRYGK